MSDAKYYIVRDGWCKKDTGYYITEHGHNRDYLLSKHCERICPTYTVSELLYKLHEWIYPEIDGEKFSGPLKFCKDAPFYIWYYGLTRREKYEGDTNLRNEDYIYAEFEYPIEGLASLLIQCHKKDIGIERKDTGDISGK